MIYMIYIVRNLSRHENKTWKSAIVKTKSCQNTHLALFELLGEVVQKHRIELAGSEVGVRDGSKDLVGGGERGGYRRGRRAMRQQMPPKGLQKAEKGRKMKEERTKSDRKHEN